MKLMKNKFKLVALGLLASVPLSGCTTLRGLIPSNGQSNDPPKFAPAAVSMPADHDKKADRLAWASKPPLPLLTPYQPSSQGISSELSQEWPALEENPRQVALRQELASQPRISEQSCPPLVQKPPLPIPVEPLAEIKPIDQAPLPVLAAGSKAPPLSSPELRGFPQVKFADQFLPETTTQLASISPLSNSGQATSTGFRPDPAGGLSANYEKELKPALEALQKGDTQHARELLVVRIAQDSNPARRALAQYWLGECLFKQEAYDQAMGEFDQARPLLEPSLALEAHYKKGVCQLRLKQTLQATATLSQLVASYPRSEQATHARQMLAELGANS